VPLATLAPWLPCHLRFLDSGEDEHGIFNWELWQGPMVSCSLNPSPPRGTGAMPSNAKLWEVTIPQGTDQ
jgi:hypothetical protein